MRSTTSSSPTGHTGTPGVGEAECTGDGAGLGGTLGDGGEGSGEGPAPEMVGGVGRVLGVRRSFVGATTGTSGVRRGHGNDVG